MSAPAWTPGPWAVGIEDGRGGIPFIPIEAGAYLTDAWRPVAEVCADMAPDQETFPLLDVDRANARLIAAAPDLAAHAASLLEAWDARTATVAEQIITGKSDRELQKQATAALEGLRAALAKAHGQ